MNLDAKIEAYSRRLAQDPHSRVFAPLADLLRQAGRLEDALELLDDGLARHPEYVSALVIKGQALLDAGQPDRARVVLTRVMEMDEENIVVLGLLANDAGNRQAWRESIPLLEKLMVLEPDDDHWPSALAAARKSVARQAPPSPEPSEPSKPLEAGFTTLTLVDIYLAQGYRAKALQALNQMAEREPGRQDILNRIAEIEGLGSSVGPGSGSGSSTLENGGTRKVSRRNNEKQQFEDWITRLRQEGGPSS